METITLVNSHHINGAEYVVLKACTRTKLAILSSNKPHCNTTSIKIIKNEVGCRDDTVPKTVDTRRHCKEE